MWRPRLLKDEVEVRAHADTITIKLVVDRMVHSCAAHRAIKGHYHNVCDFCSIYSASLRSQQRCKEAKRDATYVR
jgi:hypothetical protein